MPRLCLKFMALSFGTWRLCCRQSLQGGDTATSDTRNGPKLVLFKYKSDCVHTVLWNHDFEL